MDATFEDVVKLAEQLEPQEQDLLIYRLRVKQAEQKAHELGEPLEDELSAEGDAEGSPTREELINELKQLRAAGAFDHVESLYGKYANPNVPEISEEEFHAQMHAIATEWEQELDEFDPDND